MKCGQGATEIRPAGVAFQQDQPSKVGGQNSSIIYIEKQANNVYETKFSLLFRLENANITKDEIVL